MIFVNILIPILFSVLLLDISPSTQPLPTDLLAPDAKLSRLATGLGFTEGPVWFNEDGGYLIFSDIPANELKRWDEKSGIATYRAQSFHTNGNTRTRDGLIVSCEQANRRVVVLQKDATTTVVADHFKGKKFNSPNDVVVKSDGSIWFTDPTYGMAGPAARNREARRVSRRAGWRGHLRRR